MMSENHLFLSICIPAYNRPLWLKRSLVSIINHNEKIANNIEIVISDDSNNTNCQKIVQQVLKNWPGQWRYVHNQKKLGMAENWNQSLQLATGDYVLILHDDDFLLRNAIATILETIELNQEKYLIFLFGVKVLNEKERILKCQRMKRTTYLAPIKALKKVLSNSSFVRFPAIVFKRQILDEVGYFKPERGEIADLDMWIRLFRRYGVLCIPEVTCAYTVHSQALTMGMFNEQTVNKLLALFEEVEKSLILSVNSLQICQALFFYQFILAGAFRFLSSGKFREFTQVMDLFKIDSISKLRIPRKWLFLRIFFETLSIIYKTITIMTNK